MTTETIYAYVSHESCRRRIACWPNETYGRDENLVSDHGDFHPWTYDQAETLAIINNPKESVYRQRSAHRVAELLGWLPEVPEVDVDA